jgi:hypothetical protein
VKAAGLPGTVLLVAGTYVVATRLTGFLGTVRRSALPAAFAHSIVPIAVGYVAAHYASLLLFEGQRTIALASDPLGTGADLLGTAAAKVDFAIVTPAAIALL